VIQSDFGADGRGDFIDAAIAWGGIRTGFFDEVESEGRGFADARINGADDAIVVGSVSSASFDGRLDASFDVGYLFTEVATNRLMGLHAGIDQVQGLAGQTELRLASNDPSHAIQLAALSGPTRPFDAARKGNQGGWGTWLRGLGWYGERDANNGVLGYDYWLAGAALGGDYRFENSGWTVGGVFTYQRSDATVDFNGGETVADNYLFGAYAGYDSNDFFADIVFGGGYSQYDSARNMTVAGASSTGSASFDGGLIALRATAGLDVPFRDLFTVRPLASIDYVWVKQDSYRESGAAGLGPITGNMSVDELKASSLKVRGIVVLTQAYDIGNGDMTVIPEFRTGIAAQISVGDREVPVGFGGIGGGIMPLVDENDVRGVLGLGATLEMGGGLAAYIDLGTELGGDTRNVNGTGGLRYVSF